MLTTSQSLTNLSNDLEERVDVWCSELEQAGLLPNDVFPSYQKAKIIRRLEDPKNHWPLRCSEIIAAFDRIQEELKAERYRAQLLNQGCASCKRAAELGMVCPYHNQNLTAEPEPDQIH
jgi:hypothetical protein